MNFNVIFACTLDCGIGKNGTIPWHLPDDLKMFKKITSYTNDNTKQNMIIMGRKTWESLPVQPLPGRKNVIITSKQISSPGVTCFTSLNDALASAESDANIENVFVIGGAQLYNEALQHENCQTLYVTMINHDFNCDTFFDSDLMKRFEMVEIGDVQLHKDIEYAFAVFHPKDLRASPFST